jgi:hypothetical protein
MYQEERWGLDLITIIIKEDNREISTKMAHQNNSGAPVFVFFGSNRKL